MYEAEAVDQLCELVRKIFAEGSEDLKATADVTIHAWELMIDDEPS